MALISAKTILVSLSLFHITLGFFLITNPGTVADQALVFVLGEATGMVRLSLSFPCYIAGEKRSAKTDRQTDRQTRKTDKTGKTGKEKRKKQN